MAKISEFKIEASYGSATVELTVSKERGTVTHKYWSVPKSIVTKLVSASKSPELSDFEGWISDYRAKKDKDKAEVCCGDYWCSKD